jgi:hypothetical protein
VQNSLCWPEKIHGKYNFFYLKIILQRGNLSNPCFIYMCEGKRWIVPQLSKHKTYEA